MAIAHSLPASLTRERILEIARTLPADLGILSQLNELLRDPNTELSEIARHLRRDVALSAQIVRLSNSPMFGGGRGISTPDDAVSCVGFGEILKLVGTATAGRLSENALQCYDISAKLLRDNMLYGAFAAEALARSARIDPRIAYCAGLLRAVGLMVLDRAGRGNHLSAPLYSPSRWPDFLSWEKDVFGMGNSEVTALLLDEWNFPPELGEAVRSHYVTCPDDLEKPLAVLLNVANGMAHAVCRSFRGEENLWEVTPEKLAAAGLEEEAFESAIVETELSFEKALSALGRD